MKRLSCLMALMLLLLLLNGCFSSSGSSSHLLDRSRSAERRAVPSAAYPLAGFFKPDRCSVGRFGLAIAPAGGGYYSVSFCGPGGCFKPGTYRPNSRIVGDRSYRVINKDILDVGGTSGFSRYVRCPSR